MDKNEQKNTSGKKPILKPSLTTPAFVLVIYALLIGSRYIDKSALLYNDSIYLSLVILQFIVLIIPAIFFCRLKGINYGSKLNFKLFSPGKLGFTALATLVMISGSTIIRLAQVYIIKRQEFSFFLYDSYVPGNTDSIFNVLYIAIAFAVLPAVTEELVFRGIVLTEYNYGGYGDICSAFMSAAMFAMLHFSLGQLPVYIFCGLVLSFLVYNTQSIIPAMIAHMLYNIYGIFAESYIIKLLMRPSSVVFLIFFVISVFLICLALLLGSAERINFAYAVTGHPTPEYKLKRAEDGVTPDISSSVGEDNPDAVIKKESFSESFKLMLNAVFSPTFLICVVVFTIVAIGLI